MRPGEPRRGVFLFHHTAMPTFSEDYYRILQVHPDAEPEVIQAAYRRLARKYHPDSAEGDGTHMQALNEAYAVLSDPAQRKAYGRWYRLGRFGGFRQPDAPSQSDTAQPQPQSLFSWLRMLAPTLLTMGLLVILVLDLFRLGMRGVPEITLVVIVLGWLVYHFGGIKDFWSR